MKNFRFFTGNRLEILAEVLAEVLQKKPLSSPLAPETIVVQSKGMERWISMELAQKHGICANMLFPFPNAFVYGHLFRKVLPNLPEVSPFDPQLMTWKLLKILPSCLPETEYAELRHYLKDEKISLRHYQFAARLSDIFDHYLLFRPEWIRDWDQGKNQGGWQSRLWRKLAEGKQHLHRPALMHSFQRSLKKHPECIADLPERISVFGISTLPSFHMQIFEELSEYREVNLFFLNPCKEYWGDVPSRPERKIIDRMAAEKNLTEKDLCIGKENPFLSSMGITGRDFFDIVEEFCTEQILCFVPPGEDSLLHCIQSDIYHRRARPDDSAAEKTEIKEIDPEDFSIRLHSCHSPMREIEVLQDNLLDIFQTHPELKPSDVLVMAPDIENYAPFIQAVFDLPPNHPRRIPFSIADRGIRVQSRVSECFFRMLDLTDGRFGAAQVLSILETPAVRKKFELSEGDTDLIRTWIRETRIRWGIDSKSRKKMKLPDFPENTWSAGLDRLFLGYAMRGHDEKLFQGILPYDNLEGSETFVLGQFAEFAQRLFSFARSLSRPRSLEEWGKNLKKAVDNFFYAENESEKDIQELRDLCTNLEKTEELSGFEDKIPVSVIRSHLKQQMRQDAYGLGFITGGVTFCAMLPMRSIPFEVICLIGLNSDAYPRRNYSPGFDLMAKNYKKGDRSRRNDDRYLFLESLLSARTKLCISYTGQHITDNSVIPPSVLVSELTDYIRRGFTLTGTQTGTLTGSAPEKKDIIENHVLTRHCLQSFSPSYFSNTGGNPLFSYSPENCRAARQLLRGQKQKKVFISAGLSPAGAEWKNVDLHRLCGFYKNPSRFLLRERIGLRLEEKDMRIEEKEAFEVKGLEAYFLQKTMAEQCLGGLDLRELFPVKKTAGMLPHGRVGECVYEKVCRETENVIKKIKPFIGTDIPRTRNVDMQINGFRVRGSIGNLFPRHMLCFRCTNVKAKDLLSAWIQHLSLACLKHGEAPRRSLVAGKNEIWEYISPEDSAALLEDLIVLYMEGLKKPLPFFPQSALAYAEIFLNGSKGKNPLAEALAKWKGSYRGAGEGDDDYIQLCFHEPDRPENILNAQFQELAIRVYEPLLKNRKNAG